MRQRNDEQRKREIREAATRCFVRRGFSATRLSDIAHEAGLSKGGVYFHYQTKETIFHDILDSLSRSQAERWTFQPISGQPADRTLVGLVVAHLRTLQDDPEGTRLHNLLVMMAVQDELVRTKLEEVLGVMKELYRGVVARGIEEGLFIPGDPDTLALSILAYVNGLAAFSVLDAGGRLPLNPEQAAQSVVRMVKSPRRASAVEFGSGSPKN